MISDFDSYSADEKYSLTSMREYLSANSPLPFAAIDGATQKVIYANGSFSKLVLKSTQELVGLSFSDAVGLPKSRILQSFLNEIYGTNKAGTLLEQKHELDSSPPKYLNFSAWALGLSGTKPHEFMVQITDVTENVNFQNQVTEMNQSLLVSSMAQHRLTEIAQNLNVQLETAIQAKTLFLASMSHEIRTPLNAIMGCSELMCLSDQSAHSRLEYQGLIKRNGGILTRLIDDILDLSKIEAGKFEVRQSDTNLPELIADVVSNMRTVANNKNIEFSIRSAKPLPETIVTDPVRLTQILNNIIGNAIKFTSKGAVNVTLIMDQAEQKFRVLVEDSGKGMTPEEGAMLFQPFTQVDASNTRNFGGTGLGLDLSRRLARMLGGNIQLVSSVPGLGSTFEITIGAGIVLARGEPRYHIQTLTKPLRLDGLHILLADDAPDNQLLISRYLTRVGAKVDAASDGEEAVRMGLALDYDVILMDIQMPKLDGYQATVALRKGGYSRSIVALTAHAMHGELERCGAAGCDGYLTKPVNMQNLIETISEKVTYRVNPFAGLPPQTEVRNLELH